MFAFLKRLFSPARLSVEAASFSACGPVRKDNQDHLMVRRKRLTFCVADGMGGGEGGAEASRIVCDELSSTVARYEDFGERVRACADAIRTANAAIRAHAAKAGYRQMGTTVALLALDGEDGRLGVVGHVGDSRVYRFRQGELTRLTHDHTLVGEFNRNPAARKLAGDLAARTSALAHVLTRAVGIEREVQPEWRKLDVRSGDVYLLCSDGVYNMVSDEQMREVLSVGGAARESVARIAGLVESAGATDNYSLIVVKTEGVR